MVNIDKFARMDIIVESYSLATIATLTKELGMLWLLGASTSVSFCQSDVPSTWSIRGLLQVHPTINLEEKEEDFNLTTPSEAELSCDAKADQSLCNILFQIQ